MSVRRKYSKCLNLGRTFLKLKLQGLQSNNITLPEDCEVHPEKLELKFDFQENQSFQDLPNFSMRERAWQGLFWQDIFRHPRRNFEGVRDEDHQFDRTRRE